MSILDLDPPRLRLVSSSGSPARQRRYRDQANLGPQAAALYRQVLSASLASGEPVDPDGLRVVLAVHQTHSGGRLFRLTAQTIWRLLFVDVVTWAKAHHLPVPPETTLALVALVEHLVESGRLDPDSDPPHELYDAIDECTGGWTDRAPSRRPASEVGRSLPSRRGPKH